MMETFRAQRHDSLGNVLIVYGNTIKLLFLIFFKTWILLYFHIIIAYSIIIVLSLKEKILYFRFWHRAAEFPKSAPLDLDGKIRTYDLSTKWNI